MVRKSFYNHFSSKPYRDVELATVDARVVQLEKATARKITDIPPKDISDAIGCDGLIYGKIIDYKKIFALVYSQFAIEAEVWMVDGRTGNEVIRVRESVTYRGGGAPISPVGVVMSALSAAVNMRDIQQMRIVDELSRKLNEKIPSPAGTGSADLPLIKEVITNAKESPFGKGKVVRVGLEGEGGLVATFSIGSFKKGIPMREDKPGIYLGEYRVMPGDTTADMPLMASLRRVEGGENEWIDPGGPVTIDTTAPPPVTDLKARGFPDRIDLSWQGPRGVPDLRGFRVSRSEQPLSGYAEIGTTEIPAFTDSFARPDIAYYYRVVAFDLAGNDADPPDPVRGSLSSKEPIVLSGELAKDTVLSGLSTIRGDVLVPRGLVLFVEADTRVTADADASLTILGTLVINGKEGPVEFLPLADKPWKGITVDSGTITAEAIRVRGAASGLVVRNAEGSIDAAVITDNEIGIALGGVPAPSLRNSAISGNGTGLDLEKTDAEITGNTISRNKRGIVARGMSGEIRENNILDNEVSIASEEPLGIGANYFGTVHPEEMRLQNVTLAKVYCERAPGGSIVDVMSNPYLAMGADERRQKGAGLVGEGRDYFGQRNYGKAASLFEESLKAEPSPEAYYHLALSYQEMRDEKKALAALGEGAAKFPQNSSLVRALGMALYQKGDEAGARKALEEALRLNPGDGQVEFLLQRIGDGRGPER
jgi:parallel beta-helix repeat protein